MKLISTTAGLILLLAAAVQAAEPCCAVTAIDARSGVITAKIRADGRTFKFKVDDRKLLSKMKVGQTVHADFKTMKVALDPDGASPCCAVVSAPAQPTGGRAR